MTKVKTLAKNLPVKFLGYIDSRSNLMSLIEKAAYFIFPSETEGLSLMLLEAASTGTPIICSDIPENTQVFNDEEVLFFKNKDHHDLAQKIKWAMENPETMHIKALKAQAKALNEYSSEAIAGLYNEQYQKLLFSNPEKTKAFAKKESLV